MFAAIKRSLGQGSRKDTPEGIHPEYLQKNVGLAAEALDGSKRENRVRIAEPSVVVPWVLQEVAEKDYLTNVTGIKLRESALMEQSVQRKLHAKRLLTCWLEYGDAFPKAFATELLSLPKCGGLEEGADDTCRQGKIDRLACFLTSLFVGKDPILQAFTGSLAFRSGRDPPEPGGARTGLGDL